MAALALPAKAGAERPNIDRVIVSRDAVDLLTFEILFGSPLTTAPDTVQVAIDADRDSTTGVDGLEYSLDKADAFVADDRESLSLLTAIDGRPVASHPPELGFLQKGELGEGGVSSATFTIPASLIGDLERFDFYVFIEADGALDEAPSHLLFSAGSLPWTYPKHAVAATYPVETYQDGSDLTLDERPEIVISVIVAILLVGAGVVVAIVLAGRRRRRRSGAWPRSSRLPATVARACPHCLRPMRREAGVCPHCGRESAAWTLHEGNWWCYVDGVWFRLDEATSSWVRFESHAAEGEPSESEPAPQA
jgi:hypothetical protein